MTRLGTVSPPTKLRFDASGRGTSPGKTVTKLVSVGSVTVTLSTTAVTPLAGTGPLPVTSKRSVDCGPRLVVPTPPVLVRVSNRRLGATAWNRLPAGPALVA